jgi:hypothetical protein
MERCKKGKNKKTKPNRKEEIGKDSNPIYHALSGRQSSAATPPLKIGERERKGERRPAAMGRGLGLGR